MFNVIMRHFDWNDQSGSMPIERMFENTDREVAAQFKNGDQIAFDRLRQLPCLFIPEGTGEEVCRVGSVTSARVTNGEVRFEYTLDADVPALQNGQLYAQKARLDMDRHRHNFDWHRNHWAVKDVDLFRVLFRSVNPRRQRPSVFTIPEHESIEPALASAMMPFAAEFNSVWDSIQQAATNVNLRCRRADDLWENAAIIQDVVSLIDRSRIVICDCTGRNANVFYEAGIAHTLGRDVILITQNSDDIPFDLRHIRHHRYLNNAEGRERLVEALEARMQTILGH